MRGLRPRAGWKPALPARSRPDSVWSLWIRTDRGQLQDFVDAELLEDGEVESREELETQWWRLGIQRYKDRLFFRLSGKLTFDVDLVANAEVLIREWTETAKELGRAIPLARGRLEYA